jgi:hypothetical protein
MSRGKGMFSSTKLSPEEKAAAAADKKASRDAITGQKSVINNALGQLKGLTAKEDYEPARKLLKDGLDWLKAHPTAEPDDIIDYMNTIYTSPFILSFRHRAMFYMYANMVQTELDKRLKILKEKNPELVPAAKEIIDPIIAYKNEVVNWLENGRMKLQPDDYTDKGDEIKEKVSGPDGKTDVFGVKVLMNDKELKPALVEKIIEKQVEKNTFNKYRLLFTITKYVGIAIIGMIAIAIGVTGAMYATNLNRYRSFAFRLFYAFYGSLFFFIVIPYEWIYRRWWLAESELKMDGIVPLFDGPSSEWSWFGKNFLFLFERNVVP